MSKTIGAEVSEDLYNRIEEYREEGESRSQTIRRLIRTGLEHTDKPGEEDTESDTESDTDGIRDGDLLVILGSLAVVAWFAGQDAHPAIALIGGLVALYGFLELETNLV